MWTTHDAQRTTHDAQRTTDDDGRRKACAHNISPEHKCSGELKTKIYVLILQLKAMKLTLWWRRRLKMLHIKVFQYLFFVLSK